jgi:hypothetical protein
MYSKDLTVTNIPPRNEEGVRFLPLPNRGIRSLPFLPLVDLHMLRLMIRFHLILPWVGAIPQTWGEMWERQI